MQYALLGEVQFELLAYFSAWNWQFGSDYAEHAHLEGKPRLQWIGDKLDQSVLKFKVHAAYCDPEAELVKLRQLLSAHSAQPLVLADGTYKGDFVVTDLSVTSEQTNALGRLLAFEADLSLKESIDELQSARPATRAHASAVLNHDRRPLLAKKGSIPHNPLQALYHKLGQSVSQTSLALRQVGGLQEFTLDRVEQLGEVLQPVIDYLDEIGQQLYGTQTIRAQLSNARQQLNQARNWCTAVQLGSLVQEASQIAEHLHTTQQSLEFCHRVLARLSAALTVRAV